MSYKHIGQPQEASNKPEEWLIRGVPPGSSDQALPTLLDQRATFSRAVTAQKKSGTTAVSCTHDGTSKPMTLLTPLEMLQHLADAITAGDLRPFIDTHTPPDMVLEEYEWCYDKCAAAGEPLTQFPTPAEAKQLMERMS